MLLSKTRATKSIIPQEKSKSLFIKGCLVPSSTVEAEFTIITYTHSCVNIKCYVSITIKVSSSISNTAWLKLKVVLLAKNNGDHAAGWQFNVDKQCAKDGELYNNLKENCTAKTIF